MTDRSLWRGLLWRLAVPLTGLGLLARVGCAQVPMDMAPTTLAALPSQESLAPPESGPDVHHGGAPDGDNSRVVVIAVANPLVPLPAQAGTTPGLYDRRPRYATGASAQRLLHAVARDHGLQPLAAWPIPVLGLHCATLLLPEGVDRDEALRQLAADPRVSLVQPLQEFSTRAQGRTATLLPSPVTIAAADRLGYNDPYLPLQRNLQGLDVLPAHRCGRGQGVTLAVIDTGADLGHEDLRGLRVSSSNFVDRDAQRFALDQHGTEVLGLIGARPGNAMGIVGIAPDSRVLLYKACWQVSAQGEARCNSFTLAQALSAAIEQGAQVINLSLGGPSDPLLTRLLQLALSRGVVVVGAMPPQERRSGFPVEVPGVIAVQSGRVSDAALAAPGRDVLTLTPGGRYDFVSGSSLAAAQLSAAAALLLQDGSRLDGPAVERLLRDSARDQADGMPKLCEAMQHLSAHSCHCPLPH